jgi:dihydrodipicolinate synthase/N-acetylneuraminate lyase
MKPHNFIDAILQLFENLKNIVETKENSEDMSHSNYITVTSD